ncbi:MAG: hypothetical protein K9W42_05080 [Candidatus Heimdallarchaeota archaeon]|nr:hypothetical protein [Candidatus Heimdallarchaeota archaeon]
MAFVTRSKYFWSRFIATCVKYLGVANTQQIRYIAEKILPTEMSRQNILYHVRIAEEKGWIASFASALEMNDKNRVLFREEFLNTINEKVSAQRFIIVGTEPFEPAIEEKIVTVCQKANLKPISIIEPVILEIITNDAINRLNSTKEKASGNKSLFMVLLRFGWFWLNIDPAISLRIIDVLKKNEKKHGYNSKYKIDAELLEIASMIELETIPEISIADLKRFLKECIKLASEKSRTDIMNLMSITLLISGRYLVALSKLSLAKEYLNRGIKYLRFCKRQTILMRKFHVDGLFDLGFIYSQQGWFYKALGVFENIEHIIAEEFQTAEPTDNLRGRLALAKAELYLMMAFPSYIFKDEDYRSALFKALKFSEDAIRYYKISNNELKITEIILLSAWIQALLGNLKRSEQLLNKATKRLVAPVPAKLNVIYYNTKAELNRKQGKIAAAIQEISSSFDYLKIVGQNIAKLFCMTRLAELHVALTQEEVKYSFISFGNVNYLFTQEMSDMLSHIFLENSKLLAERSAVVCFFLKKSNFDLHPEIKDYVETLELKTISPVLLGESFTILPETIINFENFSKKPICIISEKQTTEIKEKYHPSLFSKEFSTFDNLFQKLLSDK